MIDRGMQPGLIGIGRRIDGRVHIDQISYLEPSDTLSLADCGDVVGLVGRERVVLRGLDLPPIPEDQIAGVVRSEATRQFEFDERHSVIDHLVVAQRSKAQAANEESSSRLAVEVATLPMEFVDGCKELASSHGMCLARLGLRPYASWIAFRETLGTPDVVTLLAADTGGQIEMTIGVGEQVLISGTSSTTSQAGALRQFMAVFANRFPQFQLERIVVAGQQAHVQRLAAELNRNVEVLDPLSAVDLGSDARDSLRQHEIPAAACLGIVGALHSLEKPWSLDFVHPKRTAVRTLRQPGRLPLIAIGLAVGLLLCLLAARVVIMKGRRDIETLLAKRAALDEQLRNADQKLAQYRAVSVACAERGNCLLELQRLSQAIADKKRLYVVSLAFEFDGARSDHAHIVLGGFATDHESISLLQTNLNAQPLGPVSGTSRRGRYRYGFQSSIPVAASVKSP